MRTDMWKVLLILLCVIALPSAGCKSGGQPKVLPVVVTDSNFGVEVEQAGELVLIEFWADWCGPCRMLAPILETLADEYAGRVKICKVDVSDETVNPALARRFEPEPLPCMILVRKGREVDRRVGVGGNAEAATSSLREWLNRNLTPVTGSNTR